MTRIGSAIRGFTGSLAGRIALFLIVGMSVAAFGALLAADQARRVDIERVQTYRVADSAVDVINRLQRDPRGTEWRLTHDGLIGAQLITRPLETPHGADTALDTLVAARIGSGIRASLTPVPVSVCMSSDPFWTRPRAAGFSLPAWPECWMLHLRKPGEDGRLIRIDLPRLPTPPSTLASPIFLTLVFIGIVLLSIAAAALVTVPLRRLSAASEAFARSIDAEPVPEGGPADVRKALSTFNVMQERVREGLRERTHILASISHDLQTPLTRLRLRLEQVEDTELRDRLIADLSMTLGMVKRGLDLARSSESAEPWSTVDLDSLLSSMAEDAAEFGQDVRFAGGCGAYVRVKPDALARCLTNLIDNAVKYAGSAEISCRAKSQDIWIEVRDHGPGIPPEQLGRIFSPFFRGQRHDEKDGGTGIGLTIAKAQAAIVGGDLFIANAPAGGILATLRLPRAR